MSLTTPEQGNLDVSDHVKEVSQNVNDGHAALQAVVDEIAHLDRQEIFCERQMAEIEKKLADVRQRRNLKHIQRAQVEDDLDKHTASLGELKKTEYACLSATKTQNRKVSRMIVYPRMVG